MRNESPVRRKTNLYGSARAASLRVKGEAHLEPKGLQKRPGPMERAKATGRLRWVAQDGMARRFSAWTVETLGSIGAYVPLALRKYGAMTAFPKESEPS